MIATNLIGRRGRGFYWGKNPKADRSQPNTDIAVDGEIIAVGNDGSTLCIWLLDDEFRIRRCSIDTFVIVPREIPTMPISRSP